VRNVDWGAPTDRETACRRNAGRRHYNAVRSFLRLERRAKVARLLLKYPRWDGLRRVRGVQARIARELGVSPGTVSRDVRFVQEQWRRALCCPTCGSLVLPSEAGPDSDGLSEGQAAPNDEAGCQVK
jgi:hypothetical protein